MEMIYDLNEDIWSRGDPNETTGYQNYRLMKCEKTETPGNFIYAVFDEQGFLKRVLLDGGAGCRDPLTGMSNIQLKLSPDEKKIEAIIVEDDCVKLKEVTSEVITNTEENSGTETSGADVTDKADNETVKEASVDANDNAGDDAVNGLPSGDSEQTEQQEPEDVKADEETPEGATTTNAADEKSDDAADTTNGDNVSDQNLDQSEPST